MSPAAPVGAFETGTAAEGRFSRDASPGTPAVRPWCAVLAAACCWPAQQPSAGPPPSVDRCAIDVHQHLAPGDLGRGAAAAVERMDAVGIRRSLLLPPPSSGDPAFPDYDEAALATVVAGNADRFAWVGGGTTLNGSMHAQVLAQRPPTAAELDAFERTAQAIAASGVAGFGEMAVLHLSYRPTHPYIAVRADHPMFLRLAEVAGRSGLPIDVHMELTTHPTPPRQPWFRTTPAGRNPDVLPEDLAAFERLLAHDRAARVVWAHVGWDNTGEASVELLDTLLDRHPNLYMSLKVLDEPGPIQVVANRPLDPDGTLRPEWLALLTEHPDRFVLGSDEFFRPPGAPARAGAPSTRGTWSLVDQLPSALALRLACANPRAIYRLE